MMIGPAPIIRIVERSVRLGIMLPAKHGFLIPPRLRGGWTRVARQGGVILRGKRAPNLASPKTRPFAPSLKTAKHAQKRASSPAPPLNSPGLGMVIRRGGRSHTPKWGERKGHAVKSGKKSREGNKNTKKK